MPSYQQNSHLRKRATGEQKVETALLEWTQGVEAIEAGHLEKGIDSYRWILESRETLETALTKAVFAQRKMLEVRLPELDRRFKEATVPVTRCVRATRDCDPTTQWWYFRVPASHPDWPEQGSE